MDKSCIGCVHYYAMFRANKCCNYIFDEGHMRPCPPGRGCSVYKPKEQNPKKSPKASQKSKNV